MPPRTKPEPQPPDAPPLKSAEDQTRDTRNNIPRQKHGMRWKKLLRPELEIVRDEVYEWTRGEKERSIEVVKRGIREKPAVPKREHEYDDQCAVQNEELPRK